MPGAHAIDKGLQLDVIGGDKAVLPVHQNRVGQLRLAAQLHLRRLRQPRDAGLPHHFALNVVAVLAVDEHLDVDARAFDRLDQHDLRVFEMREGFAGLAREHHLHGFVVIGQQPAQHVEFVNQRVGDRHVGLVLLRHGGVAVRAVEHQRFADLAAVDDPFERAVAFVIRTHEAHLDQAFAVGDLGIDDVPAALGGHCQRLLAEHRLARRDGGQHELFVGRAPGRDQDRLDFRRIDDRVAIGIDLGGDAQLGHDLGGVLQVDIGDRHHRAIDQGVAAATDVVTTDGAGTDDAQF